MAGRGATFHLSRFLLRQRYCCSICVIMSTVKAVAVLRGDAGVGGIIRFEQDSKGGPTTVTGKVTGIKAGKHGKLN
jgi:hypothetical protein